MTNDEALKIVSDYFDAAVMYPKETEAFQVVLSCLKSEINR